MPSIVQSDDWHRTCDTMARRSAHCTKSFSSGGLSEMPMGHTHMKGSESRRIFPVVLACLSWCACLNGRWIVNLQAGGRVVKRIFSISIDLDNGNDEDLLITVLQTSENRGMMPRYRTCNLSKLMTRYKLHGLEDRDRESRTTPEANHERFGQ